MPTPHSNNIETAEKTQKRAFKEMIDKLGPNGIKLSFEFSDTQHDR